MSVDGVVSFPGLRGARSARPVPASDDVAAFSTEDLGRRYRRQWALREATVSVPSGRVVALVGPNGAGKTTLLRLLAGLLVPSTGEVSSFGAPAQPADTASLARVAFVPQDKPLYEGFSVAEILRFGNALNPRWDGAWASRRLADLGIAQKSKIRTLSGGQRTQVALTLALAKRASLVLLDEPLADLDPLARHEVLGSLMSEVAERGTTIVLSSHILADLDRTCDWLIMVNAGRVLLSETIDSLSDAHFQVVGSLDLPNLIPDGVAIVNQVSAGRQVRALVRIDDETVCLPSWCEPTRPTLEDIVLAYMRGDRTSPPPQARPV